MADVFISHVEEDAEMALRITYSLERAGFSTWYYERDGLPGVSYLIQTGQAIDKSQAVVLIISANSLGSHQVTKEVVRAHEGAKPFLPVLVDVSHVEFQNRQPEWREAIGAAVSISVIDRGLEEVQSALIKGLRALNLRHDMAHDAASSEDRASADITQRARSRTSKTSGLTPGETDRMRLLSGTATSSDSSIPLVGLTRRSVTRPIIVYPAVTIVVLISLLVVVSLPRVPQDQWTTWHKRIGDYLQTCRTSDQQCLHEAINGFPPPFTNLNRAERFYEDMRAGQLLLGLPRAQAVLARMLGIYPTEFTGSGYSLPWDRSYAQVQAREYLIANHTETEKTIWTWEFEPAFANFNLRLHYVIQELAPTPASNQVNLKEYLPVIERRMQGVDTVPPVIRLQQFPRRHYRGTVGHPEAVRVFCSNLRDVWNMTLEEVARASGHRLSSQPASGGEETTLFVWLYVPTHPEEVTPATWGNIFTRLSTWLRVTPGSQ